MPRHLPSKKNGQSYDEATHNQPDKSAYLFSNMIGTGYIHIIGATLEQVGKTHARFVGRGYSIGDHGEVLYRVNGRVW